MQQINPQNPTPFYEQLKLILRDEILSGAYLPGAQIPTEQSLCEQYDVSRITAGRAIKDLEREGLVRRTRGKGTVVSFQHKPSETQVIKGFSKTMLDAGHKVRSKILSVKTFTGNITLSNLFHLPLSQENVFMMFRRLRFVDDIPSEICTSIVRETIGKRLEDHDLQTASFYNLYEQITGLPVIRNEATFIPIIATAEMVELLNVKPGSPHFLFRSISYLQGDLPVELGMATPNGSLFIYKSNIYRSFTVNSLKDEEAFNGIPVIGDIMNSLDER